MGESELGEIPEVFQWLEKLSFQQRKEVYQFHLTVAKFQSHGIVLDIFHASDAY